jgi:hypothetical protein
MTVLMHNEGRMTVRKFVRQQKSSNGNAADVALDFGAAAAKVARIFEPDEYKLRVQSARVIERNENILVALDLVELESGGRVDGLPLWVDGPNADVGDLAARNQHVIAQLLTLRGLPTSGNVPKLLEQLAGLEFNARLALAVDGRSGRTHNEIAEIFAAADAP